MDSNSTEGHEKIDFPKKDRITEGESLKQDHPHSGFLDHVIDIFNSFQHPIVLVEERAFRWMALYMPSRVRHYGFNAIIAVYTVNIYKKRINRAGN